MQVANALETAPKTPAPGSVVGGRFRLEHPLGEGGMGTVHAAVDLQTGARVALKLMRPELADNARAAERFRREGAALAAVRHPAIVQIREVGETEDGSLYLAMELLQGETLSARLERMGRMSPEQLLPIVLGLCDGLSAAHACGIIHRDIKPSNIHLPDPDVLAQAERSHDIAPVKLVDFGVARVRGLSKMTSSGLAVGTVRYMAPEQLSGGAIDERADLYALGVVIYEALTGEHPFERTSGEDPIGAVLVGRATPLSELRPDLPPSITQVVHRAMARLPTERFASARALADALRHAVLQPDQAPLVSDETLPGGRPVASPAPGPAAMELAPTLLATPAHPQPGYAPTEVPSRSEVRVKQARGKRTRPPVWLLLPLLVGACLVPTLGVAGFMGCGSYMTGLQMRVAMQNVRAAIDEHPEELARFTPELDRLEELHRQDRVNLFAAAAFNAHVQDALRNDRALGPDEVARIMNVVQDIVQHGGDYDIDQYSKMTEGTHASGS